MHVRGETEDRRRKALQSFDLIHFLSSQGISPKNTFTLTCKSQCVES